MSKWIKCKDELPKQDEDVFCYQVDKHGNKIKNVCHYNSDENTWYEHVAFDFDKPVQYKVIKWMREY